MEIKELVFSDELEKAIEIAKNIAKEYAHKEFKGAHLLKAILARDLSLLKQVEKMGIDVYFIEEWADVRLEELPKSTAVYSVETSEDIEEIINEAEQVAHTLGEDEVSLYAILVALASPGVAFNFDQMKTFPVSRTDLLQESHNMPSDNGQQTSHNLFHEGKTSKKYLKEYTHHLNKTLSKDKKPLSLVGRNTELNKITEILSRYSKPNVLIIGDQGIGKTELINGFATKVIEKQVPEILKNLEIYQLDLGELFAKASYKGEIEDRIKNISQELQLIPRSVLVIEEIHSLFNQQDSSGITNILKSELSKGLNIIATTSVEEYTKKIESIPAVDGMFELLKLEPKEDDIHFRMIKEAIKPYLKHHELTIDDEVVEEAVRLSKRFMKEKSLPASAISLIDSTMSMLKTAGETFLKQRNSWVGKVLKLEDNVDKLSEEERYKQAQWVLFDLKQSVKNLIGEEEVPPVLNNADDTLKECRSIIDKAEKQAEDKRTHIAANDLAIIISQKTNIPIGKLHEQEKEKLNNLEDTLSSRVIGQDYAVKIVSDAILESRSGLSKEGQPIGSFFFLGPTGTGKTELAKALAEFLFQDENAIIRFDMSEFKEEHSAALLYGAPPGYVGYEEGGLLVNKIRQKPYSIVLFDEIEKAHTSVFDVFLQIMDEGKLHDRLGKEGDFSNAIILFTSNIGSEFIVQSVEEGKLPSPNELLEKMGPYFRPEFLGRLTEIVPFSPIIKENALKIFEIHVKKELIELANKINLKVEITPKAKEFLTNSGYDAKFGARPLKGIIRSQLRRPLAKKIIQGEYKEGDHIKIDYVKEELQWKLTN